MLDIKKVAFGSGAESADSFHWSRHDLLFVQLLFCVSQSAENTSDGRRTSFPPRYLILSAPSVVLDLYVARPITIMEKRKPTSSWKIEIKDPRSFCLYFCITLMAKVGVDGIQSMRNALKSQSPKVPNYKKVGVADHFQINITEGLVMLCAGDGRGSQVAHAIRVWSITEFGWRAELYICKSRRMFLSAG